MTTHRIPLRTGDYANAMYLIVTVSEAQHVLIHGAAKTEKGAWQKRKTLAGPYAGKTALKVLRRVADGEYVEIGEQE